MRDRNIEIEYVSPLAKAQRQGDIQALTRLLELMMPLTADPSIMDYIDTDGVSEAHHQGARSRPQPSRATSKSPSSASSAQHSKQASSR